MRSFPDSVSRARKRAILLLVFRLGSARRAVQNLLSCAWRSTRPDEYRSSGAELRGRMRRCTHAPARYRRHSPPRIHGSQQGNAICSVFRTIQRNAEQVVRSEGQLATISMNSAEQHASPVRRRYPRYEIDTELHVTTPDERATMRGRSLNISEAGTAGVFVTEWEVGTAVRLEFSVSVTSRPVRVGGVLRSRSGYRYGFEFVDVSPEQREIIDKTCRTLALLE